MDSSLAQQLTEKKPGLLPFRKIFDAIEKGAIQQSLITLPVCNALAELCTSRGSKKTVTLHDISQLNPNILSEESDLIEREIGLGTGTVFLYIGNLESYQGIDLLLESYLIASKTLEHSALVLIGGTKSDINKISRKNQAEENTLIRYFFSAVAPSKILVDISKLQISSYVLGTRASIHR